MRPVATVEAECPACGGTVIVHVDVVTKPHLARSGAAEVRVQLRPRPAAHTCPPRPGDGEPRPEVAA